MPVGRTGNSSNLTQRVLLNWAPEGSTTFPKADFAGIGRREFCWTTNPTCLVNEDGADWGEEDVDTSLSMDFKVSSMFTRSPSFRADPGRTTTVCHSYRTMWARPEPGALYGVQLQTTLCRL